MRPVQDGGSGSRHDDRLNQWSWRICFLLIVILGFVLHSTTDLAWWLLAISAIIFAGLWQLVFSLWREQASRP